MYKIHKICWHIPYSSWKKGELVSNLKWVNGVILTWDLQQYEWLFTCFLVISGKTNPVSICSVLITHVEKKQSLTFLVCNTRNSQCSVSQLKYLTSYTTSTKGFSNYVLSKSKWLQITWFKTTVYSICLQALKRWFYEVKLNKITS